MAADHMGDFEKDLYGDETPAARTKRIFDTNAPLAAAQIVDMAANGVSETVRLRAAQYVVDRVLGPVGKDDQQDALDTFLEGLTKLAGNNRGPVD